MKRSFWLKSISLWLIFLFVLQNFSFADGIQTLLKDRVESPLLLRISPEFGKISTIHDGRVPKLLIHIQDAHTNSSAQIHIAQILEELIRQHKLKTVFIEGGTQDDSLSFLRPLASRSLRQRVAKKYLLKGELSGAEYLSLASDHDFQLWGVEDKALYDQNLSHYKAVVENREAVIGYLEEIQKRVERLKGRLYPREFLLLDDFASKMEAGRRDFTDYLPVLLEQAKKLQISLLDYPHLVLLQDQNLQNLPDPSKLIQEIESLQKRIFTESLTDPDAFTLHEIDGHLKSLKNLFGLESSSPEFESYLVRAKQARFTTMAILAFLNQKLYDLGYDSDIFRYLPLVDENKQHVEQFYQTAKKRDFVFIQKALSQMEKGKTNLAVLITGGYHTAHLTSLMKQKNISYAVVTPSITTETNSHRYEKILLGSHLSIEAAVERPLVIGQVRSELDFYGARLVATAASQAKQVLELSKEAQAEEKKKVFMQIDGVGFAPTVAILNRTGVFELFKTKKFGFLKSYKTLTMGEIAVHLEKTKGHVNRGYLHVALRLLATQGWVESQGTPGSDGMEFTLTKKGKYAIQFASYYQPLADFISTLTKMDTCLFSRPPPGLDIERAVEMKWYKELVRLSKSDWNLPSEKNAFQKEVHQQIIRHLDGMLVGPTLVALKNRRDSIERADLVEGNKEFLETAFDLLTQQGWMAKEGDIFSLTPQGHHVYSKFAWSYGVPVSYLPLFEKLETLLFDPNPSQVFARDENGHETHVNRTLNVRASGASHKNYFEKIDKIFEKNFNEPKFVADMGCGNGELLKRIGKTYPILMVGADFNEEAKNETRNNLKAASIPHLVVSGNINDPDALAGELKKHDLDIKDGFHIRSFLDHNRPYQQPTDPERLAHRRSRSTAAFVNEAGEVIPNQVLEQNLLEHFKRWHKNIGEHGLILIELHTMDPKEASLSLGENLDTAYSATHGYSNQYILEYPYFIKIAEEAGFVLEPDSSVTFPKESAFPAISINYFKKAGARLAEEHKMVFTMEQLDIAYMKSIGRLPTLPSAQNVSEKLEELFKICILPQELLNILNQMEDYPTTENPSVKITEMEILTGNSNNAEIVFGKAVRWNKTFEKVESEFSLSQEKRIKFKNLYDLKLNVLSAAYLHLLSGAIGSSQKERELVYAEKSLLLEGISNIFKKVGEDFSLDTTLLGQFSLDDFKNIYRGFSDFIKEAAPNLDIDPIFVERIGTPEEFLKNLTALSNTFKNFLSENNFTKEDKKQLEEKFEFYRSQFEKLLGQRKDLETVMDLVKKNAGTPDKKWGENDVEQRIKEMDHFLVSFEKAKKVFSEDPVFSKYAQDPNIKKAFENLKTEIESLMGRQSKDARYFLSQFMAKKYLKELEGEKRTDGIDEEEFFGFFMILFHCLKNEVSSLEPVVIFLDPGHGVLSVTEYGKMKKKYEEIQSIVDSLGGNQSHYANGLKHRGRVAITGMTGNSRVVPEGAWVIVDGTDGTVYINPDIRTRVKMYEKRKRISEMDLFFLERNDEPARLFGRDIHVLADLTEEDLVNGMRNPSGLYKVPKGVGLLRLEYLFLNPEYTLRSALLKIRSLFKQAVTSKIIKKSEQDQTLLGRITARIFDVQLDKIPDLPALKSRPDLMEKIARESPGFDFYLWGDSEKRKKGEDDFWNFGVDQVAKLFLANYDTAPHHQLNILFPRVETETHAEEIYKMIGEAKKKAAQKLIDGGDVSGKTLEELKEEAAQGVKIGFMIESIKGFQNRKILIQKSDFISIGTSDMTESILQMDHPDARRTDPKYSQELSEVHPLLLQIIWEIAKDVSDCGKPLAVCGSKGGSPVIAFYCAILIEKFKKLGKSLQIYPVASPRDVAMLGEFLRNVGDDDLIRIFRPIFRLFESNAKQTVSVSPVLTKTDIERLKNFEQETKSKIKESDAFREFEIKIGGARLAADSAKPWSFQKKFLASFAIVALAGVGSYFLGFLSNPPLWKNMIHWGFFTVLTDALSLWISGKKLESSEWIRRELWFGLVIGPLLGVVTLGANELINFVFPKDSFWLPSLVNWNLRVIAYMAFAVRVRTKIYSHFVAWFEGKGKEADAKAKQGESFWLARPLSYVKNLALQSLFPPNINTAAEGIVNQFFQLFYAWSVNKEGFIVDQRKWGKNKNRIFLMAYSLGIPSLLFWLKGPSQKQVRMDYAKSEDLDSIFEIQKNSPAKESIHLSKQQMEPLVNNGQVLLARIWAQGEWRSAGAVFIHSSTRQPESYEEVLDPLNHNPQGEHLYDFWIIVHKRFKRAMDGTSVATALIQETAKLAKENGKKGVIAYSRAAGASEDIEKEFGKIDFDGKDSYKTKLLLRYLLKTRPAIGEEKSGGDVTHFFNWLEKEYPAIASDKRMVELKNPSPEDSWDPAEDPKFIRLTGLLLRKCVSDTDFVPADITIGSLHTALGASLKNIKLNSRPDDADALGSNILMSYEAIPDLEKAIEKLLPVPTFKGARFSLVEEFLNDLSFSLHSYRGLFEQVIAETSNVHGARSYVLNEHPSVKAYRLVEELKIGMSSDPKEFQKKLESLGKLIETMRKVDFGLEKDFDLLTHEQYGNRNLHVEGLIKVYIKSILDFNHFMLALRKKEMVIPYEIKQPSLLPHISEVILLNRQEPNQTIQGARLVKAGQMANRIGPALFSGIDHGNPWTIPAGPDLIQLKKKGAKLLVEVSDVEMNEVLFKGWIDAPGVAAKKDIVNVEKVSQEIAGSLAPESLLTLVLPLETASEEMAEFLKKAARQKGARMAVIFTVSDKNFSNEIQHKIEKLSSEEVSFEILKLKTAQGLWEGVLGKVGGDQQKIGKLIIAADLQVMRKNLSFFHSDTAVSKELRERTKWMGLEFPENASYRVNPMLVAAGALHAAMGGFVHSEWNAFFKQQYDPRLGAYLIVRAVLEEQIRSTQLSHTESLRSA